ncbi:MAG: DUF2125 domain-containing protein [Acetobacteraceae bacterium]|nr:DUF2125 domain-containing protein [Acetobacteraceae bacterium]
MRALWRAILSGPWWRWSLVALLPLIVIGHAALWLFFTRQLDKGFAQWLALQRQAGWPVEAGATSRGGYPFAARLLVPEIRLQGSDHDASATAIAGLAWQAQQLSLNVSIWQPRKLTISASGAQSLRLGTGPEMPFRADRLQMVFPLEAGFPRWAEFSLVQLRAGMPLADGTASLTLQNLHMRGELRPAAPQGEAAITLAITAQAIRLPGRMLVDGKPGSPGSAPPSVPLASPLGPLTWALGPDIARFDVDVHLGGPLPRLGAPGANLIQAAGQWRDAGGLVKIDRLHLQWGLLTVTSSVTLALDAQLQPMGTATLRMAGQAAALDAMVAAGLLQANAAQRAKTVAAMFSPAATATPTLSPSGEPMVELPLSLQNRRLALRQFPLARLPVLTWPGQ